MGHTFSNILVHIIFSTKKRQNLLYKDMRSQLFAYMGGIARNEGTTLLKANGVDDHVHLLAVIKPAYAPADVVRKIKTNSSKWIHEEFSRLKGFAWQRGYGIFSISESVKNKVAAYIDNQEEHHHTIPFADELKNFLEEYNIEYDPEHYLD